MTTKLSHPQSGPLRTVKTCTTSYLSGKCGKEKKSAVQMLQETKAFYVKSEIVLDKKQEFRPGRVSDSASGNPIQVDRKGTKLQETLRILLDFDSSESRKVQKCKNEDDFSGRSFDPTVCFQHKSLPNLHLPPSGSSTETSDSSIKCDGDSRSAYSNVTQPLKVKNNLLASLENGEHFLKLNVPRKKQWAQNRSIFYASLRVAKSGELAASNSVESHSYRKRRNNALSCTSRSRHNSSSKHSQSVDSGRRSQGGSYGLRTGRSGLPEFPSPSSPRKIKTVWSDSGTEEDFPSLYRDENSKAEFTEPNGGLIHRSKSDVSGRSIHGNGLPSSPSLVRSLPTTEKLEFFFDNLGMDPVDFKEMASKNSGNNSPVYFSSVSSMDSYTDIAGYDATETPKQTGHPSIVERNARIIKWLCNCRKFQKPILNEGETPQGPSEN